MHFTLFINALVNFFFVRYQQVAENKEITATCAASKILIRGNHGRVHLS